ncbi:hypothetical protein GDO78_018149 [Eleutherodactylus coqui]|uniref:G-protein coupled receptors family 1 profile domain-containing protein n=1 Tax=Eleutherodactylus coqui TaxID=57060 RepID=A0A8J6BCT2_ELECQ|nr:hypothetical protein GDO78_018149 [Eleutherodactylus coqui]
MNETRVMEFILLGFGNLHSFIMGNILIIILFSTSVQIQSPMYYFLCHLSFSDLVISMNIVPNMLMMSYDRYLAICNPLRYSSIMDFNHQIYLSLWPWLLGFTLNLSGVLPISNFNFCHDNIIDHIYCDLFPIQQLSCSDTSLVELEGILFSMPVFILPCGFIIATYVYIFLSILKIPSTTGKEKAFSTCSSHLIVVGLFYGTLTAKYMIPSVGHSLIINKIVSLLHTLLTPLFNPIIYSLRNKDIKIAFRKLLTQ